MVQQELDPEQLFKKYPLTLAEVMSIEIPPGWSQVFFCLLDECEEYNKQNSDHIHIHQAKEKFGELQVCWGTESMTDNPAVTEIMNKYTAEANNVCQQCGTSPAETVPCGGWLFTLCSKCKEEKCCLQKRQHMSS